MQKENISTGKQDGPSWDAMIPCFAPIMTESSRRQLDIINQMNQRNQVQGSRAARLLAEADHTCLAARQTIPPPTVSQVEAEYGLLEKAVAVLLEKAQQLEARIANVLLPEALPEKGDCREEAALVPAAAAIRRVRYQVENVNRILNSTRYDIYNSGKYIGDATRCADGIFRWHPFLSIYDQLDACTLHDVADFLDRINYDETQTTDSSATA